MNIDLDEDELEMVQLCLKVARDHMFNKCEKSDNLFEKLEITFGIIELYNVHVKFSKAQKEAEKTRPIREAQAEAKTATKQ